jgi:butyrate kinase
MARLPLLDSVALYRGLSVSHFSNAETHISQYSGIFRYLNRQQAVQIDDRMREVDSRTATTHPKDFMSFQVPLSFAAKAVFDTHGRDRSEARRAAQEWRKLPKG